MEPMKIPVLKSQYLSVLRKRLDDADTVKRYKNDSEFKLDPDGLFLETTVRASDQLPELLVAPSKTQSVGDAYNAVELHKVLSSLSPAMAADQRLWAWLTHGRYFNYCQTRWPATNRNVVLSRWFFAKGIQRNAIGRLWWSAHLTHAPWDRAACLERYRKDDPYHYTPILLGNQDIYQGLVERDFGRSLVLRTVILDVLNAVKPTTTGFTGLVTGFMRSVNFLMKHTDLESISVDDLHVRMKDLADTIRDAGGSTSRVFASSSA